MFKHIYINCLYRRSYDSCDCPNPVLTCVDVGMFFHVRFLVKPLATVLARVGPGVRMYEQMCGERRRALEGLFTLFTLQTQSALLGHFIRTVLSAFNYL